jgi:Dolichyl-phosphate-mannose-protein mannosyltransferase
VNRFGLSRFDRVALFAVVAIAALLRLPGIAARGRFDADQGHDMATLVAFTRDGIVPLLGPKTSVGDFHHGAFYYFLLAPAAALSNGDPVAVTAFLALLGIGAVALAWWLARSIAGPLAGAVAGLLLAVSPAAIDESTFIWNPNPIAFFAVLALAAAWRAHGCASSPTRERPLQIWWAVALGAAGAVTQLHVLGVVFLVAMLGIAVLELRHDRRVAVGIVTGLGLIVVLFLPLLASELQTGFLETRRILDYLRGGDAATLGGPASALAFTFLRVVGWPIVGLVTDVPAAAAIVLAVTVGLAALGLLRARGAERTGLTWLVGILVWSTVVLAFAAPSLQQVVAGLPNDHYHAFLDPIVVILIAAPAARLFEAGRDTWTSTHRPIAAIGAAAVAAGLAGIVALSLVRSPAAVDRDGGWPAMQAAGARIVADAGGAPVVLFGLPDFKLPDAVAFPIEHAGGKVVHLVDLMGFLDVPSVIVVACDRLFEPVLKQPCGGPAEDALVATLTVAGSGAASAPPQLRERFDASPRTSISIYVPAGPTP